MKNNVKVSHNYCRLPSLMFEEKHLSIKILKLGFPQVSRGSQDTLLCAMPSHGKKPEHL